VENFKFLWKNLNNFHYGGKMISKIDSKGRVYIPKSMRKKLTRDVYLVKTPEGILIIPKPKDPIKELKQIGKNFQKNQLRNSRKI